MNEKPERENNLLSEETFINMSIQRDEWEDKRTNRKLNQGTFTNIWLFIIAMYCLYNMLKEIIPLILGISIIKELLSII